MNEIKMFFFDNDNTLFDHKVLGGISETTIESLRKLKEKGYKLCLNTSRTLDECYNIPKVIFDLMDIVILLSGAYIIFNKKVETKAIDDKHIHEAIKLLDERNCIYRYATKDGKGYLNKHYEAKEAIFKKLYDMIPPIKTYQDEEVLHLLAYCDERTKDDLLKIFSNEENSVFKSVVVNPNLSTPLNITIETAPVGSNKGTSMLEIASRLNIKKEECCAFGDGINDLDMIKLAGLGIAMGNGRQELKDVADYVTDECFNDGITKALKHFNFID